MSCLRSLTLPEHLVPDSVDGHSLLPLVKEPEDTLRTWLHGENTPTGSFPTTGL